MIFRSPQELLEFFNNVDLENSTLVFKEGTKANTKTKACACGGSGACQCPPKPVEEATATVHDSSSKIVVESFSEAPEFDLVVEDTDESVFYVNDFEAIENFCGTGKIEINGATIFMNMCEEDNKANVNLDVVVEGKTVYNVPFTLKTTELKPYIVLNRDQLL